MKSGPRGGGNVAIRIQSGLSAQARLDGVLADVAEAQERLMVARQADEELKAELDRDLTERRAVADGAMTELEGEYRARHNELEAAERDLVARIQTLRDELRGLAAKAGAL